MGIDFRQHVVTLLSVFLALLVGILVGISLSREERVEGRMKELVREFREIREENLALRDEVKAAEKELERRAALERVALPALAANHLQGTRLALIYTDDLKRVKFECALPTALALGGAKIVSETVIGKGFESSVAGMTLADAEKLGIGPNISPAAVAEKIAECVAAGGEGALRTLDFLGSVEVTGSFDGPPEVVVVFAAPTEEDEARCQAVDLPLLEALVARGVVVVVGLARGVSPASSSSYRQKGVVVVEDANTIPGQVDLLELLQGRVGRRSKAASVHPWGSAGG